MGNKFNILVIFSIILVFFLDGCSSNGAQSAQANAKHNTESSNSEKKPIKIGDIVTLTENTYFPYDYSADVEFADAIRNGQADTYIKESKMGLHYMASIEKDSIVKVIGFSRETGHVWIEVLKKTPESIWTVGTKGYVLKYAIEDGKPTVYNGPMPNEDNDNANSNTSEAGNGNMPNEDNDSTNSNTSKADTGTNVSKEVTVSKFSKYNGSYSDNKDDFMYMKINFISSNTANVDIHIGTRHEILADTGTIRVKFTPNGMAKFHYKEQGNHGYEGDATLQLTDDKAYLKMDGGNFFPSDPLTFEKFTPVN